MVLRENSPRQPHGSCASSVLQLPLCATTAPPSASGTKSLHPLITTPHTPSPRRAHIAQSARSKQLHDDNSLKSDLRSAAFDLSPQTRNETTSRKKYELGCAITERSTGDTQRHLPDHRHQRGIMSSQPTSASAKAILLDIGWWSPIHYASPRRWSLPAVAASRGKL